MTTTATYSDFYLLDGFNPDTGTWTAMTHVPGDTTLSDLDGDGTLEVGDQVDVSYTDDWHEIYTGWTYQGGPITYVAEHDEYWLASHDSTLSGSGQAESGTYTFCFARETLISTPDGNVPVEDLRIGDPVLTSSDEVVAIKWMGRQTLHPRFASLAGSLPIRIKAGALGEGLPRRDLYVSPDHALFMDGLLVQAQALVNGATIEQVKTWHGENLEYFHIELENHDLVIAEGVVAETYVDNGSRRNFDNYAEYVAMFGEESPIPELPLPRVKSRRQLPARIRKRLMDIALRACGDVAA